MTYYTYYQHCQTDLYKTPTEAKAAYEKLTGTTDLDDDVSLGVFEDEVSGEKFFAVGKYGEFTNCTLRDVNFFDEWYEDDWVMRVDIYAEANYTAEEIIEMVADEMTEDELQIVVNVCSKFGDRGDFRDADEYAEAVCKVCLENGYEIPERLEEGTHFEYVWKWRAVDALSDGECLEKLGLTDEDQESIEDAVSELENGGESIYIDDAIINANSVIYIVDRKSGDIEETTKADLMLSLGCDPSRNYDAETFSIINNGGTFLDFDNYEDALEFANECKE